MEQDGSQLARLSKAAFGEDRDEAESALPSPATPDRPTAQRADPFTAGAGGDRKFPPRPRFLPGPRRQATARHISRIHYQHFCGRSRNPPPPSLIGEGSGGHLVHLVRLVRRLALLRTLDNFFPAPRTRRPGLHACIQATAADLTACRRHDPVHPQVLDHLTVMVETMAGNAGRQPQPGYGPFSERALYRLH